MTLFFYKFAKASLRPFLRSIPTFSLILFALSHSLANAKVFETVSETGAIDITLYPGETVAAGDTVTVAFGVPFPRSLVETLDQIKVVDVAGNEIASDIRETMRWHSLLEDPQVSGIRSVAIFIRHTFVTTQPGQVRVVYGNGHTLDWTGPTSVRDTWVATSSGEPDHFPAEDNLMEPRVYATLPSAWLDVAVMRTRFVPEDQTSVDYQWHVDNLKKFGNTAITEIGEVRAGEFVPITARSVWLFDRAAALWDTYYKTGDVKWMRAAHKASQFYAGRLRDDGVFGLASWDDPKYSFSGGLIADLILTGDVSLRTQIRNIAQFQWTRNNYFLNGTGGSWNERFFTYWFLGSLSAFEATGEDQYRQRVLEIKQHLFDRAQNPVGGWAPEGGILHTKLQHDGGGQSEGLGGEPIISPWMTALMADAVWRYYIHSEDNAALTFLADLADGVAEHSLYTTELRGQDYISPRYLGSGQMSQAAKDSFSFTRPDSDHEHALDVMGMIARGVWAKRKLGQSDTAGLLAAIDELKRTSDYTFAKWSRGTPQAPHYQLRPPRKFTWWFGTTSDLEWLLTSMPDGTTPPDTVAAPTGLEASESADLRVALSWNDLSDNETAYLIERSIDGAGFSQIAELAANTENYADTTVSAAATYAYRVRARGANGAVSRYSNTASIILEGDGGGPGDQEDLAVPTDLAITNLAADQISLRWTDNSRNETHVEIQRSVGDGPFRWHDRLPADTVSYTDRSVDPETKYAYRVRAIIFQVETTAYSDTASATTPAVDDGAQAPAAPSNLVASDITANRVSLSWQDNADDETSIVVQRSLDGLEYSNIIELAANTTQFTNGSLLPSTLYFYRVQAIRGDTASEFSNVLSVTTQNQLLPLAVPTGLRGDATTAGNIQLHWNDVSSAETHFEIQRSVEGGPFRWYERLPANTTEFIDRNVSPGVNYAYRIRAIDFQVDVTEYSKAVTVTALAGQAGTVAVLNLFLLQD